MTLAHGPLPVELEGAALRLYGASLAEQLRVDGEPTRVYWIPQRAAHFLISGAIGDQKHVRWGVNHHDMFIALDANEVRIHGFMITHEDGSGEDWIVHVPATTWK